MFKLTKLTKNTRKYAGFTLVELIVVITILVILGTIAFISLGGYSLSARDSTRISNLNNLHKGLSVFQIKAGTYPMPEGPITLTASGPIIGYQGFAKELTENIAKMSPGSTKDPLDPTIYTTYSVNQNQTKIQLMNFLEDGSTATAYTDNIPNFIPNTFASTTSDYSKRTPSTKGDTLGILLGNTGTTLNQPVQESYNVSSFTGVDVVNTATGYNAVFSKASTINGSGASLQVIKDIVENPVKNCLTIFKSGIGKTDGVYTINPTGKLNLQVYCDMTTDGGGWTRLSSQITSDADRMKWVAYIGGSNTTCMECDGSWPKYVYKDLGTYRYYANFRLGDLFSYSSVVVGSITTIQGRCMFIQNAHPTYGNIIRSESDVAVDCISDYIRYR